MEESDKLLLEIARCREAVDARYERLNSCHTVVNSLPGFLFHCPEPWSGDIDKAELLVISSNPSFDPEEKWPLSDVNDKEIIDFFKNRKYKMDNMHWWMTFTYAGHILRCSRDEAQKRVVSLPIVHCASKGEEGVSFSAPKCSKAYFARIMSFFKGSKIIVSGVSAKYMFKEMYPQGIKDKTIVFAPHLARNLISFDEMITRLDKAFKESNIGKSIDISK